MSESLLGVSLCTQSHNLDSLKKRSHPLSDAGHQASVLGASRVTPFEEKLEVFGFKQLRSKQIEILQVNIGYMCNQTCNHCHIDAGPDRTEKMSRQTMESCLRALESGHIKTLDITGGAPEMHPHFKWFIERASAHKVEIIVRSNLTFLVQNEQTKRLPGLLRDHNVRVISSLPCYTKQNVDKQRGIGVFEKSIQALKLLNDVGYGTSLKLDLVYNPGGAALPGDQSMLEADYKAILGEQYGVVFNELFCLTNLPISRFLDYLLASGRYDDYMETLVESFNPETVDGLMCRNTISVDHRGKLFDCDFNQILKLPVESEISDIEQWNQAMLEGRIVNTGNHCYGCTAGAGSSCQGVLT